MLHTTITTIHVEYQKFFISFIATLKVFLPTTTREKQQFLFNNALL